MTLYVANVFQWHFSDIPTDGYVWKTASWESQNLLAIYKSLAVSITIFLFQYLSFAQFSG